ncbi:MAG TPA: copper resistance protein B [Phycisphaerales bacterium]|nr:copper resistance protein B [Phycisphaerales bacterium]|tara:strand:- start:5691 stop:6608 length:918 start_codon:yes stop_codon:yes gene_type:complete
MQDRKQTSVSTPAVRVGFSLSVLSTAASISICGQPLPHEQHRDQEENQTHPDHSTESSEPVLPKGKSLEEVLRAAANPPPDHFPDPVPDNELRMFTLIEQIEYRVGEDDRDEIGIQAQGWIGYDYNRFVWKLEGESVFDGSDEGGTETDLVFSRLINPFWYAQAGIQYANSWEESNYDDQWSGVIALQGLAPGMFEIDTSLYVDENADVSLSFEAEYDLRITQRLVLQPRAEMSFSAQDIPEESIGAGLTSTRIDARLRYEVKREFAPYIGLRYQFLSGETQNIADAMGLATEQTYFVFGFRMAF